MVTDLLCFLTEIQWLQESSPLLMVNRVQL